ncbi:hypothetical protein [Rhizobium laguerreae]|uniref:hypothetical protein n=1 Tax=Rhizobium laguerreae TaxID=1076926 RepID=UPI001C90E57D|nr:hypothetical protein [Rhizobium laguerreae]MBY3314709.1 hypothetical protein [Rhizobium laguerreae]
MTIASGRTGATPAERHTAILTALRTFPSSAVDTLGSICIPSWRRELAALLGATDDRSLSSAKRRVVEFARMALQDDTMKPDGVYRHLVAVRDVAGTKPGIGRKTAS